MTTPANDVVLGIWDGHDGGAAALIDGQLVAAVSEERLTRVKKQGGWPGQSIDAVLRAVGARPADIRCVGLAGTTGRLPTRLFNDRYARRPPQQDDPLRWPAAAYARYQQTASQVPAWRAVERRTSAWLARKRLENAGFSGFSGVVEVYDHHRCHALTAVSALRPDVDDDALIVTMDGYGDGVSAAVWRWSPARCELERLAAEGLRSSLALWYGGVSAAMGFAPGEEGKVTGLAACAVEALDTRRCAALTAALLDHVHFGEGVIAIDRRPALGLVKQALKLGAQQRDVAFTVQALVERAVTNTVAFWLKNTGCTRLAVAGGLFGNVGINGALAQLPLDEFAVFAAMGDAGLCAGAAMAAVSGTTAISGTRPLSGGMRLGPDVRGGMRLATAPTSRITAVEVAEVLANDGVVAVCRGRSEFGPRALGGRSLLFDPRLSLQAVAVGNALQRPLFMPFAPLVTEAAWSDLFDMPLARVPRSAAQMTIALPVRNPETIPAAVAGNGTARPQVVRATDDPWLADVLGHFASLTGVPALVNTSLNGHREPIVQTADEALTAAKTAQADLLVVDDEAMALTQLPAVQRWVQP